ncbi:MAG: preprotein translocase subunit SecE [bacterium]|nr:preprotein translocase subunit SecE [bacterium]MDD3805387.1 preprotein translocase subunit SecE [bacterium]MDD4152808.1 preprotein translocase subunit SecE [bacterium]MDD4558760.1 preprotein translocase subunit SecE [bacterium]
MSQSRVNHGTVKKVAFSRVIKDFFSGVWAEMKKVAWPNRKELTSSTILVIVSIIVVAVFIAILDFVYGYAFKLLGNFSGGMGG